MTYNNYKRILLPSILVFFFLTVGLANADVLLEYNFENAQVGETTVAPSAVHPNITGSNFTFVGQADLGVKESGGTKYYDFTFPDPNDYYLFSVSTAAGQSITITSITFDVGSNDYLSCIDLSPRSLPAVLEYDTDPGFSNPTVFENFESPVPGLGVFPPKNRVVIDDRPIITRATAPYYFRIRPTSTAGCHTAQFTIDNIVVHGSLSLLEYNFENAQVGETTVAPSAVHPNIIGSNFTFVGQAALGVREDGGTKYYNFTFPDPNDYYLFSVSTVADQSITITSITFDVGSNDYLSCAVLSPRSLPGVIEYDTDPGFSNPTVFETFVSLGGTGVWPPQNRVVIDDKLIMVAKGATYFFRIRPSRSAYCGTTQFTIDNVVIHGLFTTNSCEGDFDNDGDVDGSDLAIFATDFGRTNCP